MTKFLRNILAALLIFSNSSVFATEPLSDEFIYDGREGVIFSIKYYGMALPKSEKLRKLKIEGLDCSAMGGPVGKFKYINGKLWLTGLYRCEGDIELNSVYPELPNPAPATWISGNYKARLDWLCENNRGYYIYKTELQLVIDKGIVTSVVEKNFDKSACN